MNTKASTFPRSNVLVLGSNSVYSLLPATLIAQADALLERHRLEETVDLAERQLKKFQGRVTVSPEEVSRGTLSLPLLIIERVAFNLLLREYCRQTNYATCINE